MKQMTFSKVLMAVACVLILCMAAPTMAVADQAQYIYDDLGRLSQVIDGQGNGRETGSVLDFALRETTEDGAVQ